MSFIGWCILSRHQMLVFFNQISLYELKFWWLVSLLIKRIKGSQGKKQKVFLQKRTKPATVTQAWGLILPPPICQTHGCLRKAEMGGK